MAKYRTLLSRGYFPKELPPHFYSEPFAKYATTHNGRAMLASYKPDNMTTQSVAYTLAQPGSNGRELRIPHPFAFAKLAALVIKNLKPLLKIAGSSQIARSRPVFDLHFRRSFRPLIKLQNLVVERAAIRAGGLFVLKADVSQFYPSLYTHAVAWAVTPSTRKKENWNKKKLLGNAIDQALRICNGGQSQGVPIGTDISFLLTECVLARVDPALGFQKNRACRWFDDYEISFESREEVEAGLRKLQGQLADFNLRLNPTKTKITELPETNQPLWQQRLHETARASFRRAQDMITHFDVAFAMRCEFPGAPILLYAMGILFKINQPTAEVGRIAESCITQALLGEPGSAQKAFALLSFWSINGFKLNTDLIAKTISRMIFRHQWKGASSDIAWALAFCLQEKISLSNEAADVLSQFDDDCILLQALDLRSSGLLPHGFKIDRVKTRLKDAHLDREHWLLAYETVRHGFLTTTNRLVQKNNLFADFLAKKISFYRRKVPRYSLVLHPGGAPDWVVRAWLKALLKGSQGNLEKPVPGQDSGALRLVANDVAELAKRLTDLGSVDEALARLLDVRMIEAGESPEVPEELPEYPNPF